jgi:hypothetical protein
MANTNTWERTAGPGAGPSPDPSGGTSGGNADIRQGTNPLTGFASRYDSAMLDNAYANPWAILPDVFAGINMAGPGYQALRDIGADPVTLYNIMQGGGSDLYSAGTGGFVNWLANLYQSLGSVGGRQFSASELLGNLFNPRANSSLRKYLETGDASQQMRTLFQFARDASNVGMNPIAARGFQGPPARAGDQALNQMLRSPPNQGANNVPVYELIRQIAPGLVPG